MRSRGIGCFLPVQAEIPRRFAPRNDNFRTELARLASRALLTYAAFYRPNDVVAFMHRLTARVLMVLLLAGVLVPVAEAITAPTPHACCLRKPMHDSQDAEFQAPP